MVGVIWVIQLVHYPSFKFVKEERFGFFEYFHSLRISWIVVPIMLVELATAVLMVYFAPEIFRTKTEFLLLVLVIIWAATFFLSAPIHKKLHSIFERKLIRKLVSTNWIRTFFWTARGLVLFSLVLEV